MAEIKIQDKIHIILCSANQNYCNDIFSSEFSLKMFLFKLISTILLLFKEKDLVQKLFNVLAPRYSNYTTSFTQMHVLPCVYPGHGGTLGILELKGCFVFTYFFSPLLLQRFSALCMFSILRIKS